MLNTKTIINIKTDKVLKESARSLADELGISLGTLLNSFLKQFIRTKEIHLSLNYYPSKDLIKSILIAEDELSKGKVSRKYKNSRELVKSLES